MVYNPRSARGDTVREQHKSPPCPSRAKLAPPRTRHRATSAMPPESLHTHRERALERLSALADAVRINGNGAERCDVDDLVAAVRLGQVAIRDAHTTLTHARRDQQGRAAA